MNILIDLGSHLLSEALHELLARSGYESVVVNETSAARGFVPDVLLVDLATLQRGLPAQYPQAKVLFMDAGMEPEKLCTTLLSYRIHGVLSPHTELPLLKKALTVVSQGQIWVDNGSVKAMLHDAGIISQKGRISHITSREQEIIECLRQGLSNKEIARKLALSEHTVKAHLNTVFKKFNVTSRSKLITLVMHGRPTSD